MMINFRGIDSGYSAFIPKSSTYNQKSLLTFDYHFINGLLNQG